MSPLGILERWMTFTCLAKLNEAELNRPSSYKFIHVAYGRLHRAGFSTRAEAFQVIPRIGKGPDGSTASARREHPSSRPYINSGVRSERVNNGNKEISARRLFVSLFSAISAKE